MKRSDHRILTTHAGRLDGSPELMKLSREVMAGRATDVNALAGRSTRHCRRRPPPGRCRRRCDRDGEVGKFGFGSLDGHGRRLSGLTTRPLEPGEAPHGARDE